MGWIEESIYYPEELAQPKILDESLIEFFYAFSHILGYKFECNINTPYTLYQIISGRNLNLLLLVMLTFDTISMNKYHKKHKLLTKPKYVTSYKLIKILKNGKCYFSIALTNGFILVDNSWLHDNTYLI